MTVPQGSGMIERERVKRKGSVYSEREEFKARAVSPCFCACHVDVSIVYYSSRFRDDHSSAARVPTMWCC